MSNQLSKEEFIKQIKETRENMNKMCDEEASKVASSFLKYIQYLDTMVQFGYTASNTLLVMNQCPDAKELKDFSKWKEENVSILKGQEGIKILEPNGTYIDKYGNERANYKIKNVFDVSQTDKELQDTDVHYPSPLLIQNVLQEGKNSHTQVILHDLIYEKVKQDFKENEEFLIQSVTYALEKKFGLPVKTNLSSNDLKYFNGMDVSKIKSQLMVVRKVYKQQVRNIEIGVYKQLKEKKKQYER